MKIRTSDLRVELKKATSMRIIVMLVKGAQVAFDHLDKKNWPKDFFHLLAKQDGRKWVEAIKKEVDGRHDSNAILVVNTEAVPNDAKVAPLGDSIKRDGR